eukprot:g18269.t1
METAVGANAAGGQSELASTATAGEISSSIATCPEDAGEGPPWWNNGQGSPRLPPPPPDSDNSLHKSTAATAGADEAGAAAAAGRRFWRADYGPSEFASVRRASERVTLNLSGTLFMTTRDTLARNPHTYFAAMLRMQAPTTPGSGSASTSIASAGGDEENGGGAAAGGGLASASSSSLGDGVEFFIDRDPTHFRFILNYLRDSYIGLESFGKEDLHFLEELSHEAQFFNIAGLCSDISRRMSDIARQHREGPSGDKDFRLVQCSKAQIQDLFHEWVIEKNYEFECMQIVEDTAYIVLGRRVSRGELALVERLMKT